MSNTLVIYTSCITTAFLAFILTYITPPRAYISNLVNSTATDSTTTRPWSLLEHLGGTGPYITHHHFALPYPLVPPLPCRVDQLHILARHSTRYPTVSTGVRMLQLYHRLMNAVDTNTTTFTGPLAFLPHYSFFMPEAAVRLENLVPVGPFAGTLGAFAFGTETRTRYEELVGEAKRRGQMRFWASGDGRVADTARYWAAGLWGLDWEGSGAELVVVGEEEEEEERAADTLTPGKTCLAYRADADGEGRGRGYEMLERWTRTYLPRVRDRLREFTGSMDFDVQELFTMQEMCAFEILAKGGSPWCDVFTREEWEEFEYARDLLHYYRAGQGNKYAGTLGWLYLNATKELLEQGPEAGQVFASFVHDGGFVPFLVALDLFPQHRKLPTDHVMRNRTWKTSDVAPMGARIMLERWACPVPQKCWSNEPFYPNHVYCDDPRDEHFVRIIVNDAAVAMRDCRNGPADTCPLDAFATHVRMQGRLMDNFGQMCKLPEEAPRRMTFLKQPPARKDD